jgi:hypothetical protein
LRGACASEIEYRVREFERIFVEFDSGPRISDFGLHISTPLQVGGAESRY